MKKLSLVFCAILLTGMAIGCSNDQPSPPASETPVPTATAVPIDTPTPATTISSASSMTSVKKHKVAKKK